MTSFTDRPKASPQMRFIEEMLPEILRWSTPTLTIQRRRFEDLADTYADATGNAGIERLRANRLLVAAIDDELTRRTSDQRPG